MSFTTNVGQNWPALIAVITFMAAGLGYLRWAKSQAAVNTIKLLNDEINAQKLTIARLEGEKNTIAAQLTALSDRIQEQGERIALLTDLLRGAPAWVDLQTNYKGLETAIRSLDPVIAIFQQHCAEQDEIHGWMKTMRDRIDQLVEMYPGVGVQVEHLKDTKDIKEKVSGASS